MKLYFYPIVTWPDCPLAQNAFTPIFHQLKFSPLFSYVAEMPRRPQRLYYPLLSFNSPASLPLENFAWDVSWKHFIHFASGNVFACLFYSVQVKYVRAGQEGLLIWFSPHTCLTCGLHAKQKVWRANKYVAKKYLRFTWYFSLRNQLPH